MLPALLLAVCAALSGCAALGLGTTPRAAAPSPSPGTNWIVFAPGSAAPAPVPSVPAAVPVPSAILQPPIVVPPVPTVASAWPACPPNTFSFSKIALADAVAGTTSAKVTWWNLGGANLVQFRLTALSQDLQVGRQRDVGWVTVKPGIACTRMTATITGLDRKTGYVFSVDAVVVNKSGESTHAATVARSQVTRTL